MLAQAELQRQIKESSEIQALNAIILSSQREIADAIAKIKRRDNSPQTQELLEQAATLANKAFNNTATKEELESFFKTLPEYFGDPKKINHAKNLAIAIGVLAIAAFLISFALVIAAPLGLLLNVAVHLCLFSVFAGAACLPVIGILCDKAKEQSPTIKSSELKLSLMGLFSAKKIIPPIEKAQPRERHSPWEGIVVGGPACVGGGMHGCY